MVLFWKAIGTFVIWVTAKGSRSLGESLGWHIQLWFKRSASHFTVKHFTFSQALSCASSTMVDCSFWRHKPKEASLFPKLASVRNFVTDVKISNMYHMSILWNHQRPWIINSLVSQILQTPLSTFHRQDFEVCHSHIWEICSLQV